MPTPTRPPNMSVILDTIETLHGATTRTELESWITAMGTLHSSASQEVNVKPRTIYEHYSSLHL